MNKASRLALVFHVFVSLLSASAAQAESDQELLALVRDAHRAARESLQTVSCRVEFAITIARESKPPVTHSCSSRYWLSPKAMRAKISENNQNTDSLWDNSVWKSVIRQETGGAGVVAQRRRYSHRHFMRCDPFVRGLLVFNLPNTLDFLPFEEFVERASKLKKVKRIRTSNKELIMVQLFFDSSKKDEQEANIDLYFDPNVNYLVRKAAYSYPTHRLEDEVVEFKEHQPSLFFPEQVVGTAQRLPSKSKYYDSTTKFSDVQLNKPLPKDIFNFKYPHGVSLGDDIRGSDYRVDADGNPISQETPYGQKPPLPASAGDAPIPGTETQEEPRSATRWILPISIGILAAAGVVAFYRRRRRQGELA